MSYWDKINGINTDGTIQSSVNESVEGIDYSEFMYRMNNIQTEILECANEFADDMNGVIMGTLNETVESLNESASENMRNIINKIIETIKAFFKRIYDRLDEIFSIRKKWIEKNKSKILSANIENIKVTTFEKNIDNIKNIEREFDNILRNLMDQHKYFLEPAYAIEYTLEKQINRVMNAAKSNHKPNNISELKDIIIKSICGDKKEIKLSNLNKEGLLSTIEADSILPKLRKEEQSYIRIKEKNPEKLSKVQQNIANTMKILNQLIEAYKTITEESFRLCRVIVKNDTGGNNDMENYKREN